MSRLIGRFLAPFSKINFPVEVLVCFQWMTFPVWFSSTASIFFYSIFMYQLKTNKQIVCTNITVSHFLSYGLFYIQFESTWCSHLQFYRLFFSQEDIWCFPIFPVFSLVSFTLILFFMAAMFIDSISLYYREKSAIIVIHNRRSLTKDRTDFLDKKTIKTLTRNGRYKYLGAFEWCSTEQEIIKNKYKKWFTL